MCVCGNEVHNFQCIFLFSDKLLSNPVAYYHYLLFPNTSVHGDKTSSLRYSLESMGDHVKLLILKSLDKHKKRTCRFKCKGKSEK